jgi:hypothetical protein
MPELTLKFISFYGSEKALLAAEPKFYGKKIEIAFRIIDDETDI